MPVLLRLATLAVTLVGVTMPGPAGASVFLNQWGGGTLGFVVDGTSNTILLTETTNVAICVDQVGFSVPIGSITDGTSNTFAFSETAPWSLQVGFVRPRQPIGSITDGTSNTILIGETPNDALCFGDGSVIPPITDGTSNTILFGENSSFDVCLRNVRVGAIADGTSNTIVFSEVLSDPLCYSDARIAPALTAAVFEPQQLVLTGLGLAGFGVAVSRRGRAPGSVPRNRSVS